MAIINCMIVVFTIGFVFPCVFSTVAEIDVSEVFNDLLERIESLEARDAAKNSKIAKMESEISGLKSKMGEMELNFEKKEAIMLDTIDGLKQNLAQSNDDTEEQQLDSIDDIDIPPSTPDKIKQRRSTFRKNREAPETEVAFYATHTDHAVHHLGSNQILLFQQPITNIGNAYNNNTGSFVAPVAGTYVFHATVLGIDINLAKHVHAHFDVNGTRYSEFWVTGGDQSSQMLVIDLKAGHTVTVKNDFLDNGFVGQHFSTFSGFLLYQHFPSGTIIG